MLKELLQSKRPQLETRKLWMEKLTGKGKHTVKVGNNPHTNMISRPAIMRRGEHKCRILEKHLKLKDQQLKTILFIYILLYQNITVTTNGKYNRYTHTKKGTQRRSSDLFKGAVRSRFIWQDRMPF